MDDGTTDTEQGSKPISGSFIGLRGSLARDSSFPGITQRYWYPLVEEYSRRQLTQREDKLAAFSGITTLFQRITLDTPLAGLWRYHLHIGLMWYVDSQRKRSGVTGVPSWSWMYVDDPVSYQGPLSPSESLTDIVIPKIEVCSCVITWSGQTLTSRIANTGLRLIGRVVPATNLKKEAGHNNRWHIAGSLPNDPNGANEAIGYCYIDIEDAYIAVPLLCFEVSMTKERPLGKLHEFELPVKERHHVLILQHRKHSVCHPEEVGYVRLGAGVIFGESEAFRWSERKTVSLF